MNGYTIADLRRMEDRVSSPLDPEREAWEFRRCAYARDGASIVKVPRIEGASFTASRPADIVYSNQAAGTAKNTFTTEVGINDTAGMGAAGYFPKGFWPSRPDGQNVLIGFRARGILSSTATPTYTFSLRLGAAASITAPIVLGSAALTTGSGVTNQLWEFEGEVNVVTLGAAGANTTLRGLGLLASGGLASPFSYGLFGGAASPGTVATFDIGIDNFINFNVACSASSASNSVQLLQLVAFGWN